MMDYLTNEEIGIIIDILSDNISKKVKLMEFDNKRYGHEFSKSWLEEINEVEDIVAKLERVFK